MSEFPLPASRVRAAVAESLEPILSTMVEVRNGFWAKELGPGIRAVVGISPLKGASNVIPFGVCCVWVPLRFRPTKYGATPNTLKQSTKHLWVDHHNRPEPLRQTVSAMCDEGTMRIMAERATQEVIHRAPDWWERVQTPAGVLAEARLQAQELSVAHHPPAEVVTAFTLAHMGEHSQAEVELQRLTATYGYEDLRNLLPRP